MNTVLSLVGYGRFLMELIVFVLTLAVLCSVLIYGGHIIAESDY